MAFRRSDGNLAQNDEENMEVLEPHFMKVFNMKREVKFEAINRIPQRDTMHKNEEDISFTRFEEALEGLTNNKAARDNKVPPNAVKALENENPGESVSLGNRILER